MLKHCPHPACAVNSCAFCGTLATEQRHRRVKRRYTPGQIIVSAGQPENWFATILSGVVTLTKNMADGREQIVGLLLASDFLGRPFARANSCGAQAATTVELCCFERQYFEDLMRSCLETKQLFLERTLAELDAAREWMLLLGCKTAEERVASLVLLMAKRMRSQTADGSSRPHTLHFHLPLSRTQMAECLGLRVETVCRQIKRLRTAGIIETSNGRAITVHDMGRLERMTE